ncbi:MAG: CPBP family intramembrane glutamic endopeptidase [Pseudomonadota bacterium]
MRPAFIRYIAPAQERPQLWRLATGLAVCTAIYGLVAFAVFGAFALSADQGWTEEFLAAETPRALMAHLSVFLGMALGPMAAVLLLHRRRPGTLFGRAPIVLRDFTSAAAVTAAFVVATIAVSVVFLTAVPNRPVEVWLVTLPAALLLVALQTGAEELLFRGYIQQQLAARFRSPLIWAVIPSLAFGALHFDPVNAGANAWLVAGGAVVFGLAAADLTARTGSLGAAWGFHFANNVVALLFFATDGPLSGLALFRTPFSMDDPAVAIALTFDLIIIGAIWFVLRRLLAR